MKILMCASEAVPFAKTGGLADVVGALPLALEKQGIEVRVIIPKYRTVYSSQFTVQSIANDIEAAKLGKNIQVYFIKNDNYFNRSGLYGEKTGDYPDNLDRFSFYSRRTLDLLKEINFRPDILHCHDWQAALIPVYLKNIYNKKDSFYKNIKTLFTIHNLAYQGLFGKEEYEKLGLDWSLFDINGLEFYGKVNVLKGGIIFSDLINTVSSAYAKEIQAKEFGCGLEGVLGNRQKDIYGIINGLDYQVWDPAKDKYIYKMFSVDAIENKYINKKMLQKECNLTPDENIPLFGIVGRLAEQKGMDLIAQSMKDLIKHSHIQIVVLGTGDLKYHHLLEETAKKHPHNLSAHIKFDDSLAHKIYAASDIFLMPSRYEPCGLGQMIALKYGTIPLVFKTGGLADTINNENGFVFDSYTKEAFVETVKKALDSYRDKKKWLALVKKAFTYNFSWDESAKKYIQLYEKLKK